MEDLGSSSGHFAAMQEAATDEFVADARCASMPRPTDISQPEKWRGLAHQEATVASGGEWQTMS
jgi:hypothetical protein